MKKVSKICMSLITLVFVLSLFPSKGGAAYNPSFTDIYLVPWAEEEIYYLAERGIIHGYEYDYGYGYGYSEFGPNDEITREQAAVILVRELYPNEKSAINLIFSDVEKSNPYYNAIAVAVEHELFVGYSDNTFKPKDKLTRAAAAKILALAYNLTGENANFKDINSAPWAADYINALATNNITTGYPDNTFKPNHSVTRAEFSVFLARILESDFKPKNEKVYPKYNLQVDYKKFPVKLKSGLTVDITDEFHWPVILKDGKEVWTGEGVSPYGEIQFTVTEENDTFLYFKTNAGGTDTVDLVGIHEDGEVFINESINGDGAAIVAEFLTVNNIEIGIERYNDNHISMADRFTGIYDFNVYSLSSNGEITALDYIDDTFATLAKRGKLKDVPGNMFMPLNGVWDLVGGNTWGWDINTYLFHDAIKAKYGLRHHEYKVAFMSRLVNSEKTKDEIATQLSEVLGDPVQEDVYKAGKYYVTFEQNGKGKFEFYLGTSPEEINSFREVRGD